METEQLLTVLLSLLQFNEQTASQDIRQFLLLVLSRLQLKWLRGPGNMVYKPTEEHGEKNTYTYVCLYMSLLWCVSEVATCSAGALRSVSGGRSGYSSAGPT